MKEAVNVSPESGSVPGGFPVLYISLSAGRNKLRCCGRCAFVLKGEKKRERERRGERERARTGVLLATHSASRVQ